MKQKSYSVAEFCIWIIVALGFVVLAAAFVIALMSLPEIDAALGSSFQPASISLLVGALTVPAILGFAGLILIAFGQMLSAIIDTAKNTQELLAVFKGIKW